MKIAFELFENFKLTLRYNSSIYEKLITFWILNSLTFKSFFFENSKEKFQKIFTFKVYTYSFRVLRYLYIEIFVNNDYLFRTEKNNPIIFDCGANIGLATLFFKLRYPNSIIKAFEPNPNSFSLLKKNIDTNKLDGIEIFNVALSNKCEKINFFISDNPESLRGSIYESRGKGGGILIQSNKVSDYLGEFEIDLLKIDVEGAEHEIIEDILESKNIHGKINSLIIEYHHNILYSERSLSKFLSNLESLGFQYNLKSSLPSVGKFQDILIYSKSFKS